jgi:hypothetical protein
VPRQARGIPPEPLRELREAQVGDAGEGRRAGSGFAAADPSSKRAARFPRATASAA